VASQAASCDERPAEMFVGNSCGLRVDAAWKIDKKRID
jgi:hypothetical protein